MDADLNTEYYADRDQMERRNLLEQILSEDNAANVQQYPQKSYAERIVLDDSSYDYVIIAREDRDGVIICYEDVTADDEDMSEFSLNSLLSGDSFRNNAIIVITDGKQVLCSNAKEQVGRMMEKCPAVDIEDGEASDSDHGMFQMTSNGDNWYGKHDIYREYYLYVFYKDSDVFSDRQPGCGHDTGAVYFWMPESHYFGTIYQENQNEEKGKRISSDQCDRQYLQC